MRLILIYYLSSYLPQERLLFVGGGAVFFSIQSQRKFINDKSPDLFNLYVMTAQHNVDFFRALDTLLLGWQSVSKIVDGCATDLLNAYKAYSMDKSSQEEFTE